MYLRSYDLVGSVIAPSADLLLFSMISNLWKSRNYTKDAEDLFFDPQPWLVYIAQEGEEIGFTGGVKLKSDIEIDQHSRSSGDR